MVSSGQISYNVSRRISQSEAALLVGYRQASPVLLLFESAIHLYLDNTFPSSDKWNLLLNGRGLKWIGLEDILLVKLLIF